MASFFAHGEIDEIKLNTFEPLLKKKSIEWFLVDAGDRNAGSIGVVQRASNDKETTQYKIHINRNHAPAVKFATLAHELGHLFLGHLGSDRKLNVPERTALGYSQQEIEAESVAFMVCGRNDVTLESKTYLSNFVNENTTDNQMDVFQVLRAAGQVETLLELAAPTQFDRSARPDRDRTATDRDSAEGRNLMSAGGPGCVETLAVFSV